jgi:hypothetical protein
MWNLESRLQLKSRALFIHAFGGAVDVHLKMYDQHRALLTADFTDPLYKRIAFEGENTLLILLPDREPPPLKPYVGHLVGHTDPRRRAQTGEYVHDGDVYDIWWCNRRVGGTFRRKEMWLWSIEPHESCKPTWWEDEDWIARVVERLPHVRDLLVPART